jgi:glycosyltransferase involved in cell wall biosynthesis
MLVNRAYYLLKPILPWRVRLMLRQWRAARRRRTFADVWPIDPKSSRTPDNWPEWPQGKRFAFVLTHDVEGTKGVSRVKQLRDLEISNGFRSSFNFVPEGEYRLTQETRRLLEEANFEVGVHGLHHDGKLYSSKAEFAARAERIREYMREWGACGFRSPLMQHQLGWLHALEVDYDASTFDTDPFEPEPDGAGTIFPYWVPASQGRGFVELPYTLVQDLNLFCVLREKNIDIWKRKADWVAEHGGMVLLNTHPDYMCFEGKRDRDEYPLEYYSEFLRYIREKYEGQYWSALPPEVSSYYRETMPVEARNTRRKICMIGYTPYESDNRVRRYAETLAQRGDHVDIIGLSRETSQPEVEEFNGVTVHRIQHREHNEKSKWSYASRLLRFLYGSSRKITQLHQLHRYDVVHIHNMPDFLVFAAWYPRLHGAKLILDIHDVVPELFGNKFRSSQKSAYVESLKAIEKLAAGFVDHVIVSNHLWHKTVVARSVPEEKSSVFINHVDPKVFARCARTRNDGKFIVLFPGSLQWHQGVDIAIEAFALIKKEVPHAEFHIYCGSGVIQGDLMALTRKLGVQQDVKFIKAVSLDEMAQVIANADLGVVPKRADSFGNEAYSTKIMEFMSQGVPVVASRTKIDAFYFEEGVVHFFESGSSTAMAQAMLDVIRNPELRDSLARRGEEYVKIHGWERKKKDYLDLIDALATEEFGASRPSQEVAKQTIANEDSALQNDVAASVPAGNHSENGRHPVSASPTRASLEFGRRSSSPEKSEEESETEKSQAARI